MMGLAFFPEPLEDELFYSVMARFRAMTGRSHRAVFSAFFGKGVNRVSVDLPVRLNQVSANIDPDVLSGADLLNKHTLFAYYMRFLDLATYAHARKVAAEGWESSRERSNVRTLKLHASEIGRIRFLRFCPECVDEDKNTIGMAGWRRSHQCPGVFICPRHDLGLIESSVGHNLDHLVISCPGHGETGERVSNPFHMPTSKRIASATAWLLAHPQEPVGVEKLRERTRSLLYDRGWVSKSRGEVASADLHQAMLRYYGAECFQSLKLKPSQRSWVVRTYAGRLSSQVHPLHYLLLLEFLGLGPSDLFDDKLDLRSATPRMKQKSGAPPLIPPPRDGLEDRVLKHRATIEGILKRMPNVSRSDVARMKAQPVNYLRMRHKITASFSRS